MKNSKIELIAKSQMDLLTLITFECDELGFTDTDKANEIVFKLAETVITLFDEDRVIEIGEIKNVAAYFGAIGKVAIDIFEDIEDKSISGFINEIFFELATQELHQGQFLDEMKLHATLAQIIAALNE